MSEIYDPQTWREAALYWSRSLGGMLAVDPDADMQSGMQRLRDMFNSPKFNELMATTYIIRVGRAAMTLLDGRGIWSPAAMADLLCRKQADYGHGNINAFGVRGIIIRMNDKVERWFNLADQDSDGLAEPAVDALWDLVGYTVIAMMLEDGTFQLPSPTKEAA